MAGANDGGGNDGSIGDRFWWASLVQGVAIVVAAALFLAVGNAWLQMQTFIQGGTRFSAEDNSKHEREMRMLIESEIRLVRQQTLQYQEYSTERVSEAESDIRRLHAFVEEVCKERKLR